MSWVEFSRAVEAAYRRQGYGVRAVAGTGANFEITKEGRTALVNCKRWKSRTPASRRSPISTR